MLLHTQALGPAAAAEAASLLKSMAGQLERLESDLSHQKQLVESLQKSLGGETEKAKAAEYQRKLLVSSACAGNLMWGST